MFKNVCPFDISINICFIAMFRKKKQQQSHSPATTTSPAAANYVNTNTKSNVPPPVVEDFYDNWTEGDNKPTGKPPIVEDEYDNWDPVTQKPGPPSQPPVVEDLYEFKDAGDQEYEDVDDQGDIFGFDKSKANQQANATPSWANQGGQRPISMQHPPPPRNAPPSGRPLSEYVNKTPYQNVISGGHKVLSPNKPPDEGESYEEMEDLDLRPKYQNVSPEDDVGGGSYEEVEDLDKPKQPHLPEVTDLYDDMVSSEPVEKPASIAERQKQLQQSGNKEQQPKKRGLAADYQKIKFEMLAQKFKDIETEEKQLPQATTKPGTLEKKKSWQSPNVAADATSPEKGTVDTLTRSFQGTKKPGDKLTMKGLLWHKPPGRSKYHEEFCELDGSDLKLFKNKNDSKPYFTINTTQCDLAVASEEWEKKNVFKLTAGSSRDHFGAFNASEMKQWMNALKPVVKGSKT